MHRDRDCCVLAPQDGWDLNPPVTLSNSNYPGCHNQAGTLAGSDDSVLCRRADWDSLTVCVSVDTYARICVCREIDQSVRSC